MFKCPVCTVEKTYFAHISRHCIKVHKQPYSTITGQKWCNKCKNMLDISNFCLNRSSKDGIDNLGCKKCKYEYDKRYHRTEKKRLAGRRYARSPHGRFMDSKKNAKKVGHTWSIPEETWVEFLKEVCTYCAGPLNETGSALDRIDNTKGYELDNVVPSCFHCNRIRSNIFTYNEMLEIGKVIKSIKTNRTSNKLEMFYNKKS